MDKRSPGFGLLCAIVVAGCQTGGTAGGGGEAAREAGSPADIVCGADAWPFIPCSASVACPPALVCTATGNCVPVPCTRPAECPGNVCQTSGCASVCAPCRSSADCAGSPYGPTCDPASGRCGGLDAHGSD